MIVEESLHQRRLIGRIADGRDLIDTLTTLCTSRKVFTATFQVTGKVQDIELVDFDEDKRAYAPVLTSEKSFQIVSSKGWVTSLGDQLAIRFEALVSTNGPLGQQFAFGQVRRALATDCEFTMEATSDLIVERRLHAETGQFPIETIRRRQVDVPTSPTAPDQAQKVAQDRAPSTPAPSEPERPALQQEASDTNGASLSWEEAAVKSEDVQPARRKRPEPRKIPDRQQPPDVEIPLLKAGDILDHPKLGKCRVMRVEDEIYAHIRLERGQIRKLSLELCELTRVGEEKGRRLFDVRIRK